MENELVKNEKAVLANRFTQKVLSCYGEISAGKDFTDNEKSLIAGYFVKVDESLKEQNISWNDLESQNILNDMAMSMANKAMLGLDMRIDNHLNIIPSKNYKTGKITIKYITGYKGELHKAKQFAIIPPLDIKAELVYATDEFEEIHNPQGDSYNFKIVNPFKRGEIIGGFAYTVFKNPVLNRIFVMDIDEILERKPFYVKDNDNFWSKHPKAMYKKTLIKEACKSIDIDVNKIDKFRKSLDFEEAEMLNQEQEESNEIANEATTPENTINVDFEEM